MEIPRPLEVKPTHLARAAKIYCRQSSEFQVANNRGSTEYQRGQRGFAEAWGWKPDQIEIVDEDLGLTGAAAHHRRGYLRILDEMRAGRVGAVFVSDPTRLGRSLKEYLGFLEECSLHDVLLIFDGKICNIGDSQGLFTSRLLALVGEYESAARQDHIRRGINAKIAAGRAVTAAPAGYISFADGSWDLDPDPAVQAAISVVFRLFLEERSCARTVRKLVGLGIKLPRRPPGRPLRWIEPNVRVVRQIVRNLRYSGDYVFREQVTDRNRGRGPRGQLRVRPGSEAERLVVSDHHPRYVSREQQREIFEILRLHAPSQERRHIGPGTALLQGLIRCGRHRSMSVGYKKPTADGGSAHSYYCKGDYDHAGPQCGHVAGRALDTAIAKAVVSHLGLLSRETIDEAWEGARKKELQGRHHRQTLLNRARQRAVDLEARFLSVSPANRLVAEDVERKLEQAKQEVERLEKSATTEATEASPFTREAFEEVVSLSSDLFSVFSASTTSNEDRKEVLRAVVKAVIVEKRTRETIQVRIVWEDGGEALVVEAKLSPYAYPFIKEWRAQGTNSREIALRLNEMNLLTRRSRPWSREAVEAFLRESRKRCSGLQDSSAAQPVP
jgi:DNA invertase Pin-like site-specific DNA recombinase